MLIRNLLNLAADGGGRGVKEMKVPAVGESITEVTISTWLKKDGDFVTLDENHCRSGVGQSYV